MTSAVIQGRKVPFCFQIKGGLTHDGAVGKAEVLLIVLTDSENDALCVGEHHVICQDQIVFWG